MSGLRRLGEICRVVRVVAYSQWVHDMKVETLARCGAGWQPARRLATAAVRRQRGISPIDNRPQPAKLPHKSPRCLAYTYARIQAVLLMNRLGVHFCVAHPGGCAGAGLTRTRGN